MSRLFLNPTPFSRSSARSSPSPYTIVVNREVPVGIERKVRNIHIYTEPISLGSLRSC